MMRTAAACAVLLATAVVAAMPDSHPDVGQEALDEIIRRTVGHDVDEKLEDTLDMDMRCGGDSQSDCLVEGSGCLWCESGEDFDKDAPSACVSMDQIMQFPAMMHYSCMSAPPKVPVDDAAMAAEAEGEPAPDDEINFGSRGAAIAMGDDEDACNSQYKDKDMCNRQDSCTWCKSSAVPSGCFTLSNAKRLPPSVFMCDSDLDMMEELIQTAGPLSWLLGGGGDPDADEDAEAQPAFAPDVKDAAADAAQAEMDKLVREEDAAEQSARPSPPPLTCTERFDDQLSCEGARDGDGCAWCVVGDKWQCLDALVAMDAPCSPNASQAFKVGEGGDSQMIGEMLRIIQHAAESNTPESQAAAADLVAELSDDEAEDDEAEAAGVETAAPSQGMIDAMNTPPAPMQDGGMGAAATSDDDEAMGALAAMNAPADADDDDEDEDATSCQGQMRDSCSSMEGCVWCVGMHDDLPSLCSAGQAAITLPTDLFVCGEMIEAEEQGAGQVMGRDVPDQVLELMNALSKGHDLERTDMADEGEGEGEGEPTGADMAAAAGLVTADDMINLMNQANEAMAQVTSTGQRIDDMLREAMNTGGDVDVDEDGNGDDTPSSADRMAEAFDYQGDDAGPFALPSVMAFQHHMSDGMPTATVDQDDVMPSAPMTPDAMEAAQGDSMTTQLMRAAGEAMRMQQQMRAMSELNNMAINPDGSDDDDDVVDDDDDANRGVDLERQMDVERLQEEAEDAVRQESMATDADALILMARQQLAVDDGAASQNELVKLENDDAMDRATAAAAAAATIAPERDDEDDEAARQTRELEEAFHSLPSAEQQAEAAAAQREMDKLVREDDAAAAAEGEGEGVGLVGHGDEKDDMDVHVTATVGGSGVATRVDEEEVPAVDYGEQALTQVADAVIIPDGDGDGDGDGDVHEFKVSPEFTMNLPDDDDDAMDVAEDEVAAFMNGEAATMDGDAAAAKALSRTHAVDEAGEGVLSMLLGLDDTPVLSSCLDQTVSTSVYEAMEAFSAHLKTADKLVEAIEALAALAQATGALANGLEQGACGVDSEHVAVLSAVTGKLNAPDDVKFHPQASLVVDGVEILHAVESAATDWDRQLYGGFGFKVGKVLAMMHAGIGAHHPPHPHHAPQRGPHNSVPGPHHKALIPGHPAPLFL